MHLPAGISNNSVFYRLQDIINIGSFFFFLTVCCSGFFVAWIVQCAVCSRMERAGLVNLTSQQTPSTDPSMGKECCLTIRAAYWGISHHPPWTSVSLCSYLNDTCGNAFPVKQAYSVPLWHFGVPLHVSRRWLGMLPKLTRSHRAPLA